MMKKVIAVILLNAVINYCLGQDITSGGWKIKSGTMIVNTDTFYLFKNASPNNILNLSNITYWFGNNNQYGALAIDSSIFRGTWKILPKNLIIDGDTSELTMLSSKEFTLSSHAMVKDSLGHSAEAVNWLRFYNTGVSEYTTAQDGNWNTASTWEQGVVPPSDARVVIQHHITITENQSCNTLIFIQSGNVLINSGVKLNVTKN